MSITVALGACTPPADERMVLMADDGTAREPTTPAAAVASARVTLEGDERPAWMLAPGSSHTVDLRVPRAAALRFAYGLQQGRMPLDLEVTASRPGSADRPPHHLFRAVLAPDAASGRVAWRDVRVDLGAFAGQRLRLRFRADGPSEGDGAMLLVAHPEVTSQRPPRRPNIVMISIDGLRADALSLAGHHRTTSPSIDAWARSDGTVFDHALAASAAARPARVSLLSGLDALHHGVGDGAALPASLPYLPDVLHAAGYRTAAVVDGHPEPPPAGDGRGFDRRYRVPPAVHGPEALRQGVDRAIDWLDALIGAPFFLLIESTALQPPLRRHEPHFTRFDLGPQPADLQAARPAAVRDGHTASALQVRAADIVRPLDDRSQPLVRGLYDSAVAAVDLEVQRVLDALVARDVLDDTVVVLTAPRSLAFGPSEATDDALRVPLLIAYPRDEATARRLADRARTIDVTPTLLALARVDDAPGLDGRSLEAWMAGAGDEARAAWSWSGPSRRLDHWPAAGGRVTLATSPWPPDCGTIDVQTAVEADRQPGASGAAGWERRALLHLQTHASGLVLRWRQGPGPRQVVRLAGDPDLPRQLSRLGGACPEIHRLDDGAVDIAVAEGQETWLVWQTPSRAGRSLALRVGDAESFSSMLDDLPDLSQGLAVQPGNGHWQATPLRGPTATRGGLAAWWIAPWQRHEATAGVVTTP